MNAPPIKISYRETTSETSLKTHFHNTYELIFIAEGSAEYCISDKVYKAHRNSLLVINNFERHEMKVTGKNYRRYFMLINPDYFQSVIQEPTLASVFKHHPDNFNHHIELHMPAHKAIVDTIQLLNSEVNGPGVHSELLIRSALQQLVIFLFRDFPSYFPLTSPTDSMNTILQIQRYIEEHSHEQISLRDISKKFCIDMFYASHLFKKVTGLTFKRNLILQRIARIKERLLYSSDSITQVGFGGGFNNVNNFIKTFKHIEGTTPYQYRKKFRTTILPED